MQASQIKLGGEYAVHYKGQNAAFRADEIISHRNTKGTVNYVAGYMIGEKDENGLVVKVQYEVANILGPIEAYRELMAAKAKAKADAEATTAAAEAKKKKAAVLLANAIGVYAIQDRGFASRRDADQRIMQEGPNVSATYSSVEVSTKALDYLIAYLEAQGVSPVDRGIDAMEEEEA